MSRITLKIVKPAAPTDVTRERSSRAKRAQLRNERHKPPAAAPAVSAPAAEATRGTAAKPRSSATPASPKAPRAAASRSPVRKTAAGEAGRAPVSATPSTSRRRTRTTDAAPPRTPRAPLRVTETPELPRLSKRMSELGLCSRREADDWIRKGWVKVDGAIVDTLGTRVSPDARIEITKAAAREQHELVTILLHKPIGYVSGQAEDGHTPASVLVVPENHWADDRSGIAFKPAHLRGLAPAGRLDIDSTGLLVFTQDGRVAKRLIGQNSEVEKEYLVRVQGTLRDEDLQRLRHGLVLDGVTLKPARVTWQNEDQLRFVLREGRKRQIRRMCELVGLAVTGLKRVRSGSVLLGALPAGKWRYLRPDEAF